VTAAAPPSLPTGATSRSRSSRPTAGTLEDSAGVVGALSETVDLDVREAAVTTALDAHRIFCCGIGPSGAPSLVITEALAEPLRERGGFVLETPSSPTATASESMAGFAVAHALTIDIAARTRDLSVSTMSRLNELREHVTGRDPSRPAPAPGGG
jgi:DNA-binding MurR/RpiR family transcriptional regulator